MLSMLRKLIPGPVKRFLFPQNYVKAKRFPYLWWRYPKGVNVYGFLTSSIGLGQGVRLYVRALDDVGIPLALIDERSIGGQSVQDVAFASRLAEKPHYRVSLVHLNPDVLPELFRIRSMDHWDRRYVIGVWLWELERLPEKWKDYFQYFDEIWVPSRFIQEAVVRETNLPVRVIPYGIEAPFDPAWGRSDFGLPQDAFLVLCMFDVRSYSERKNPMAAVRAFFAAFSGKDKARLVLKVHNASPEQIEALYAQIGDTDRVIVLQEEMERLQVNALIRCCDVLISLHRSEGFGLVLAEAMALGTPVVATNWSANTEFMGADDACMVRYEFVHTQGVYRNEYQRWAEPDEGQAAGSLRRLYEDKAFYESVANAGQKRIASDFSIAKSGALMAERLRLIFRGKISKKRSENR